MTVRPVFIRILALALCAQAVMLPRRASASQETKIFLTTATYGVLAGSLTGLASLAFYETPGEHMRNVAMGASLGLYAGVVMGAYLIYAVPDGSTPTNNDQPMLDEPDSIELNGALSRPIPYVAFDEKAAAWRGGVLLSF